MKKVLLKCASIVLTVGLFATGAFAQQQGDSGTATGAKNDKGVVLRDASQDIYRNSNAELTPEQKAEKQAKEAVSSQKVARPIVKKEAAKPVQSSTTVRVAREDAAQESKIPADAVKSSNQLSGSQSGPAVNVQRVNNTSKALPADYKPAANETKTTDK